MLKIGICGLGKMGMIRANSLERNGKAKVVKTFDRFAIANSPYPMATSFEDILTDTAIDAVCICLPNSFNYKLTVEAMENGKDVLCEKPPAFTLEEVIRIQEVEKKTGQVLMYGFNHRHHQAVVKMKSLIDSGQYGRVLWMRGRYGKSVDENYFNDWRSKKELAGGGILFDQGIHMLDLFHYLGGKFDDVHAYVSNLYWNLEGVEDNVFAIMKNTQTGLVASLHSTMTQWRHLFSLEVFMESGYLVLNGLKTGSGTYGDEVLTVAKNRTSAPAATWSDEETFHFETDTSWDTEAEIFIDCIEQRKRPEIGNSGDAFNVMELISKIYENERDQYSTLRTSLTLLGN